MLSLLFTLRFSHLFSPLFPRLIPPCRYFQEALAWTAQYAPATRGLAVLSLKRPDPPPPSHAFASSSTPMRYQDNHHNDSNNNYHNDTTTSASASASSSSSHVSKLVAAACDATALARSRDLFMRSLRHTALPLITSSSSIGGNATVGGNTTGAATGGASGSTHNMQRNPSPFTLRACAAHALVEGLDTPSQTPPMHPTTVLY